MVKAINQLRPKFTTNADGSDAVIFMHELVGEEDGPTIGISASIHGNENTGSQAILDLFRVLKEMPIKAFSCCRLQIRRHLRSTSVIRPSTRSTSIVSFRAIRMAPTASSSPMH
jgi:hypothetical protein